jgi:hypothetical protein
MSRARVPRVVLPVSVNQGDVKAAAMADERIAALIDRAG